MTRRMHVRVPGFQIFEDRHGKWRAYHRKTRVPIDLKKYPIGTVEFCAEVARITELGRLTAAPKAGTLAAAIEAYRRDLTFLGLAAKTRRDYSRVLDYLKPLADLPLVAITPSVVVKIRDCAAKGGRYRWSRYVKTVLSLVLTWSVEHGLLSSNPAKQVENLRRPRDRPEANRPWTDAERHVVLDQAPAHMRPALALMAYTGLAPGDALKLPKSFYQEGTIATWRSKTGEPVFWPAPEPLQRILAEAPAHDALTLCANVRGKPWTTSGFRASWRTYRAKLRDAGQIGPGLTLYGLRHTVAVILRECGFDERTIADVLGQRTIEMARHYARGADLTAKMHRVSKDFGQEMNRRRTKVSNLGEEVSNLNIQLEAKEGKS